MPVTTRSASIPPPGTMGNPISPDLLGGSGGNVDPITDVNTSSGNASAPVNGDSQDQVVPEEDGDLEKSVRASPAPSQTVSQSGAIHTDIDVVDFLAAFKELPQSGKDEVL